MLENLSTGFIELKRDEVFSTVKERLEQSDDPIHVLEDARLAMVEVGNKFKEGELFLSEMLLAAEIFKEVMSILKPRLLASRPLEPHGIVVLATPKGDIHDLGKNIFATLLDGQGFKVYDLIVDVDSELIIKTIKDVRPDFLGFSALITTAFASMKHAAELLEKEALRKTLRLMVGGGVTTPMLKDHIGADFQTTDAIEGVSYCLDAMAQKASSKK
jgi:methanogenic corrinoid protein MtbC1